MFNISLSVSYLLAIALWRICFRSGLQFFNWVIDLLLSFITIAFYVYFRYQSSVISGVDEDVFPLSRLMFCPFYIVL